MPQLTVEQIREMRRRIEAKEGRHDVGAPLQTYVLAGKTPDDLPPVPEDWRKMYERPDIFHE